LIIFLAALAGLVSIVGCNIASRRQAPVGRPSVQIQTNLYGQMDSYEPVDFSDKPFSSLVQHSFCREGGDSDPDISQDGKWIVFSSLRNTPNPDIYIKQVSGFTATQLTSDPASEIHPCFSPMGDKVAYATNRSGSFDIWVVGVDGTKPVQLTNGPGNDIHPSWSPDGRQIVYCSYGARSHKWELWVIEAANPSVRKMIGYGLFPQWCPNPEISKIAYQQSRFRGDQWFSIWTVDIDGGEAKLPTIIVSDVGHACITPSWSRDGKYLSYCAVKDPSVPPPSDNSGHAGEDIWIVRLDGTNNHRITGNDASDFSPCWAPDGRIFFCSDRQYIDNIWSAKPYNVDFTAEKPVDLSKHPQNGVFAN